MQNISKYLKSLHANTFSITVLGKLTAKFGRFPPITKKMERENVTAFLSPSADPFAWIF